MDTYIVMRSAAVDKKDAKDCVTGGYGECLLPVQQIRQAVIEGFEKSVRMLVQRFDDITGSKDGIAFQDVFVAGRQEDNRAFFAQGTDAGHGHYVGTKLFHKLSIATNVRSVRRSP